MLLIYPVKHGIFAWFVYSYHCEMLWRMRCFQIPQLWQALLCFPTHTVSLRHADSRGGPERDPGTGAAESCPLHGLESFSGQISFSSRLC